MHHEVCVCEMYVVWLMQHSSNIRHGTVNITMGTLNKEQMKTTDTPELLTPPLTHTATCTAHTHASSSICNITPDFSGSC